MKITKYLFILLISLTLAIVMSGCSGEPILSDEHYSSADIMDSGVGSVQTDDEPLSLAEGEPVASETNAPEIAVSASVPSPFALADSNFIDFKNEMAYRLSLENYYLVGDDDGYDHSRRNFIKMGNIWAYDVHEVAYLTEFYFIMAEIDGFELVRLYIDRGGITYSFRCIEAIDVGISIDIRRPSGNDSPDEVWRIITEQALLPYFRGIMTDSGMIYHESFSEIVSRIGDTWMSIRVSDRLNTYEFLRDLALDVIETSRPVVVEQDFFRRYLEAAISVNVDDSVDLHLGRVNDFQLTWRILPDSVSVTGEAELVSENPEIAEINSDGLITAVSVGETTVTITVPTEFGEPRARVRVNVLAPPRAGNVGDTGADSDAADPQTTSSQDDGEEAETLPATNPFDDVNSPDWFYDYITFVYRHGLMTGTGQNLFRPNLNVTRAMVVQVLYNKQDRPSVEGLGSPFADVASDRWYTDAVVWAYHNDIVSGFGDGTFRPGDYITRAHQSIILSNYADIMGIELPTVRALRDFADNAQIRQYARASVEALFQAGVVNGRPDGRFDPQGNATRAELATMLQRFVEVVG